MKMTGRFHHGAADGAWAVSPNGRKCSIEKYNPRTGKHRVVFNDGDVEFVLESEIIGAGAGSNGWHLFWTRKLRDSEWAKHYTVKIGYPKSFAVGASTR
jgi:hypothetical protein